jgi:hypothetical protein
LFATLLQLQFSACAFNISEAVQSIATRINGKDFWKASFMRLWTCGITKVIMIDKKDSARFLESMK